MCTSPVPRRAETSAEHHILQLASDIAEIEHALIDIYQNCDRLRAMLETHASIGCAIVVCVTEQNRLLGCDHCLNDLRQRLREHGYTHLDHLTNTRPQREGKLRRTLVWCKQRWTQWRTK